MPQKAFPTPPCGGAEHPVLPPVSRSYSGAQGRLVTHYSPVRHSHPGSKLPGIPFDLHVLSTPPAFILSQNRTLHNKHHGDIQQMTLQIHFKRNQTDHPIRKDGHTKTPDTNQGPLGPPTRRTNPPAQARIGTGIIKDDQAPPRPRQPQRQQPWSSSTVHAIEFSNHHHTAGEHTRTQSGSSPTGSKMNNLHAPHRKHKPTPNQTTQNP